MAEWGRKAMRRDNFERFYYEKIALGEGCGCAEHVTRMRDLDELAVRSAERKFAWSPQSRQAVWLRAANLPWKAVSTALDRWTGMARRRAAGKQRTLA